MGEIYLLRLKLYGISLNITTISHTSSKRLQCDACRCRPVVGVKDEWQHGGINTTSLFKVKTRCWKRLAEKEVEPAAGQTKRTTWSNFS